MKPNLSPFRRPLLPSCGLVQWGRRTRHPIRCDCELSKASVTVEPKARAAQLRSACRITVERWGHISPPLRVIGEGKESERMMRGSLSEVRRRVDRSAAQLVGTKGCSACRDARPQR